MVLVHQKMTFGLSFVKFLCFQSHACFLKFVQRFLYMYFSAFVLEFKLLLLEKMRENWFTLSLFILKFLLFFRKCTLLFPMYFAMLIIFPMGNSCYAKQLILTGCTEHLYCVINCPT